MKQIFLYGIAGASDQYRVVRYTCIDLELESLSIRDLMYEATALEVRYPSVEEVYAIDNRHGLRQDYMRAFKKNSIESWAIFKSILQTEGLKVI